MNKALHFTTSDPNDWSTPRPFFEELTSRWGPFALDVCALPHNAKCDTYYTPEINGLAQPWHGSVWCNPPYGHGHIPQWLAKAVEEIRAGRCTQAVFLVPSATDTAWFHDFCVAHASAIVFIRNRLHFSNPERTGRGSHPSMVVIFKPKSLDRHSPRWKTLVATESVRKGSREGPRRGPIQRKLAL